MKHKFCIAIFLVAIYLCLASFTYASTPVKASNVDSEKELSENIDDIVDNLDLSALEEYLSTLTEEQISVFGNMSIKEKIKLSITGNIDADFQSFFSYIAYICGIQILHFLPLIISTIGIAIAFNLLNSLRGKFASDSVRNIVYFACVSLLLVLIFAHVFSVISVVRNLIENMQKQIRIFFPVLLTLMTAVGASSSVAVYQPGVAILADGIGEILTMLILPIFTVSITLTAVGNLTDAVKLDKLSDFFSGMAKWLLGSSFFLFSAFMAVQGITASVYDNVSVRTAKFALGKYVPIIGGYLSDGLNLVMSGSVLVKNAVGATAILLLFVSVIPAVVQILLLSFSLRFSGAITEPLGDKKMSTLITTLGKNLTLLISMILAITFLYFIFLILIICTGNLAL